MKNLLTVLAVFAAAASWGAGLEDTRISFSTVGPDRYADGSQVLDGECYALVWSKDGVFDGFSADGKCVDREDKLVLAAPVAKDGKCPPVLFQIPAEEAKALDGGKYEIYLMDTRVSSGDAVKPRGTTGGEIGLLNGYGAVTAALEFGGSASRNTAKELQGDADGQIASVLSRPADCAQPKIKDMRIDGDKVYLTVENLKGFMRVQEGKDVKASDSTGSAVEAGGGSGDMILVAPKSGATRFYKVIRN